MLRLSLGLLLVPAVILALVRSASAEPYQRLLDTIAEDDAYKVRMQAVRILAKKIERSKKAPSDAVIRTLSGAVRRDPEKLVRGLACFALGKIGDPRGEPALEAALKDPEAFVRAQAEQALKKVRSTGPKSAGPRVLVVGTNRVPGVEVASELEESLKTLLESGFSSQATGYAVGQEKGEGYHMKGSIAELSVVPDGDAKRVTMVVKIAIATWPDNNLRHVMSARASARARVSSEASLVRLQRKLLEAAVKKAISDSVSQIGPGGG